ncbi:MAG: pseudaminic acid synthase [Ilumatobacteraceae bacterium]
MNSAKRLAACLEIDGRSIGSTHPPFVIAEVSGNHNSSKAAALEIIAAAAESGADAIKLQHYTAETITVRSDHPDFQVRGGTVWDGRQLADLYAEAMTPWDWTDDLAAECERLGVTWFSTPFDPTAVDFLERYDVPVYKIASFELVDLPLIRYAASKRKPLIMSTGMATVGEIDAAVTAARDAGAAGIALLRCNSGYPADPAEMDLRAIPVMADLWQVPIGLSDHTLTNTASIAAVALGACVIEKHVTLRRADGGPDAAFSLEPHELTQLVHDVKESFAALGAVRFGPTEREVASRAFRRSLRVVRPIGAGETITIDNVRSIRPSGGLEPDSISSVLGAAARRDLAVGDPLKWTDLSPTND